MDTPDSTPRLLMEDVGMLPDERPHSQQQGHPAGPSYTQPSKPPDQDIDVRRPRRARVDRHSQQQDLEHFMGLANAQLGLGQVAQRLALANNAGALAAIEEEARRNEEEERRRRGALTSSSSQQPAAQGQPPKPGQPVQVTAQHLQAQQAQIAKLQQAVRQHKDYASQLKAQLVVVEAKFQEMKDENRALYNQVQDLKGNIRVFCRVRPVGTTGDYADSCLTFSGEQELVIHDPKERQKNARGKPPQVFKFDRVFGPQASQKEVYEDTSFLVRSVLDGFNVCIFAYGQTGAGKTHTMFGTDVKNPEGRGINFRALEDLFALKTRRQDEIEYTLRGQMLEIYNEQLRDLLTEEQQKGQRLEILATLGTGSNVPNATQVEVNSPNDVLFMLDRGARQRATADTSMNERSSRSHMVLTVVVEGSNKSTGVRTFGCLSLIDLAGSERVDRSGAKGERLEEVKNINSSLSALGDVMVALGSKSPHVPFRNSKLTQLLADSLSGTAKVMMFLHIAPESSSYTESASTLKFGSRVSEITLGRPKKNINSIQAFEVQDRVRRLQSEVDGLKQMLSAAMREKEDAVTKAREATKREKVLVHEVERLRAQLSGGVQPVTSSNSGNRGYAAMSMAKQTKKPAIPRNLPPLQHSSSSSPPNRYTEAASNSGAAAPPDGELLQGMPISPVAHSASSALSQPAVPTHMSQGSLPPTPLSADNLTTPKGNQYLGVPLPAPPETPVLVTAVARPPSSEGLRRLNMEVEKLRNRRLAAAGQLAVQQEFEKRLSNGLGSDPLYGSLPLPGARMDDTTGMGDEYQPINAWR